MTGSRPLVLPAVADADAAQRRPRERVAVAGEVEVRRRVRRVVIRPQAQVRRDRVGVDHLAGVHLPIEVPDAPELAVRLHQLGGEHLRQQLGAGLAVAVLARQRAAVGDDEVGGLAHEGAELAHALGGVQVEADAAVDAALAEVPVQRRLVAVPVEQPA
jgi:hypothetical protein